MSTFLCGGNIWTLYKFVIKVMPINRKRYFLVQERRIFMSSNINQPNRYLWSNLALQLVNHSPLCSSSIISHKLQQQLNHCNIKRISLATLIREVLNDYLSLFLTWYIHLTILWIQQVMDLVCKCGLHPQIMMSSTRINVGRRFMSCPVRHHAYCATTSSPKLSYNEKQAMFCNSFLELRKIKQCTSLLIYIWLRGFV